MCLYTKITDQVTSDIAYDVVSSYDSLMNKVISWELVKIKTWKISQN